MTNRLTRRNHGKGHSYHIDGRKALGVTTVLSALPKDALVNWAARTAAERAVNEWDELAKLPPTKRLDVIQWGHRDKRDAAALRGTQIHTYGEKLVNGEDVDVPDEHVGPANAYARWLDEWQIERVATEVPLAHCAFGYAGTGDLFARIGRLGDVYAYIDLKTSNGVYEATSLQCTAYSEAEIWQPKPLTPEEVKENQKRKRRKGDEPLIEPLEEPMPAVEECYVAHIKADHVLMLPVTTGPEQLRQFRYLIETKRWLDACKDEPPIGRPIFADDYEDTRTAS